ncbi:hypothetical protein ACVDG3_14530 [Meridianimarinicoccus sp. RP-17]|uniref:hypothetical protein n=1 Tax=Meridianimarinicoccus zhengii TaxID=2056810 RepID=UPI000DAC5FCC|nr:hypothetical protein [Phycocomes zhengii]
MQTILEGSMLIFFSVGWYMSIAKMLVTGVAAGKSKWFVSLISAGYAAGVCAKLIEGRETGTIDPIVWLYAWNMAVCLFDLVLVIHYSRRAKPGMRGVMGPTRYVTVP